MMILLTAPRWFNFKQTIKMLQRGDHDPINIIADAVWTRIFRLSGHVVLIKTMQKNKIVSEILSGSLDPSLHRFLIKESLGLDDPIIQNKIKDIPYPEKIMSVIGLSVPGYPDLFEAIIQIIMGQQVSVLVANKVRSNFTNHFGGEVIHEDKTYRHFPHPEAVIKLSHEMLRLIGLSQTKAKSILQVSNAFVEDEPMQQLRHMADSQQIRMLLMKLHGVGEWTVDWLLLRGFRKFEVIPSTDLAVRKAFTWWLNKKVLMSADNVKSYERKLYPYGGAIAYRVLCAYSAEKNRKGDA